MRLICAAAARSSISWTATRPTWTRSPPTGLVFCCKGEECCLTGFHTSACADCLPVMDIVILMVKATQTDDVMPDVMHCVGPDTVLVSLQNGIGNDEILAKYVPAGRIMYGAGVIGTELAGPGVCVSKPEDGIQMFFGAVEKSPQTDRGGQVSRGDASRPAAATPALRTTCASCSGRRPSPTAATTPSAP